MSSAGSAEGSWRSTFLDSERAAVIEKLTRILLSISAGPEANNLERIQQIALRFESQVYAAATSKKDYYEIISTKINSIAERKKGPGMPTEAASTPAKQSNPPISPFMGAPSSQQPTNPIIRNGSFPFSGQQQHLANAKPPTSEMPKGTHPAVTKQNPFVPNPQQLLMNTLGKSVANAEKIGEGWPSTGQKAAAASTVPATAKPIQLPATKSDSQPVKPGLTSQPGKMPSSNPFIPQIGIGSTKPPQLLIPATVGYTSVSTQPSPRETFSSNAQFSANASQSAPINGSYSHPLSYHDVPNSPVKSHPPGYHYLPERNPAPPGVTLDPLQRKPVVKNQPEMNIAMPMQQVPAEPGADRNRPLTTGALPNLSLSADEKMAVHKIVDSLKIFLPKIDLLLNVSSSIGISQDNLKKVVNLKNILLKQIELFKNDVYLLSPFMAENLSEHLKKFISLLLSKINGHPAAQSIIEKLRRHSPSNGQDAEKQPEEKVSIEAVEKPVTSSTNQPFIVEKKHPSPTSIIKESPFKPIQKPAESAGKYTDIKSTKEMEPFKQNGIQKKMSKSNSVHNPESNVLHRIPTLNYIKTKYSKKKRSISIEYLKSQFEFISECNSTLPSESIPLRKAILALKGQLSHLSQ